MSAIPSNSFTFLLEHITFQIEKQDMEMFPGCEIQMVIIDCDLAYTDSEAGSWLP